MFLSIWFDIWFFSTLISLVQKHWSKFTTGWPPHEPCNHFQSHFHADIDQGLLEEVPVHLHQQFSQAPLSERPWRTCWKGFPQMLPSRTSTNSSKQVGLLYNIFDGEKTNDLSNIPLSITLIINRIKERQCGVLCTWNSIQMLDKLLLPWLKPLSNSKLAALIKIFSWINFMEDLILWLYLALVHSAKMSFE